MNNVELNNLIDQLKSGDLSVFDEIYYETYEYVYYVILSIVKNSHIADELSQETYFRMLKKIKLYRKKNFHAWIGTLARNITYNYIKKKQAIIIDESETNNSKFKTNSTENEEILLNDMERILKEEEITIVILHVINQYPHRKIAEMLGIPLGTVTWKYREAMKKLREGL